jgi:formamidopyrimidine-DNA glycosylase
MPEGDTVYRLARRLDAALAGQVISRSDLRVPQHATADLSGFSYVATATHGKHLLTRLRPTDGQPLTLHTHLRMDGSWTVLQPGRRLPRHLEPDIRVLLEFDGGGSAVGLKLPVVDLVATRDEHSVVGHLGPDPLRSDWDADEAVRRLLADPARPFVAALLDQTAMAGLGNLWVNEVSFLRGVWPWTPVGDVDMPGAVRLAARMLRFSATHPRAVQVTTGDLRPGRQHWVSGRAGRPCLRCGTTVLVKAEVAGDPEQRRTWWCPSCQPAP